MTNRVTATHAENAAAILTPTSIADEGAVTEPIVPYREPQPIGPASASISQSAESGPLRSFKLKLTINPLVVRILRLADHRTGWNTYGAGPVDEKAQSAAIDFVGSFDRLPSKVPAPAVAPLANRGIALKWLTEDREIDIRFFPDGGGDYCVVRRRDDELVAEGMIDSSETLKGVVEGHVLGRLPLRAS